MSDPAPPKEPQCSCPAGPLAPEGVQAVPCRVRSGLPSEEGCPPSPQGRQSWIQFWHLAHSQHMATVSASFFPM